MSPRGCLDKGRLLGSWNPREAAVAHPLAHSRRVPVPCFCRAGHGSEAVLPDGNPGLPDLDPDRALWAFVRGGPRGPVRLQHRGPGAARSGERWDSGRHTEGTGQGLKGVARAGRPSAQRVLSVSELAIALPFWFLPGGMVWGPGVTHSVAQAVLVAPTWHMALTVLMCPLRSSDLLGGPS